MYKIRGGDGKEYGPVTMDTLRDWVNQGRANGQTFVQAEGGTEWKMISTLPEFAALFSPPLTGMSAGVVLPPVDAVKTSGLAVTSLILGCVGLVSCGTTALIGLPLGIVAMVKVKKSQGRLTGWGMALAGTIVSGVALLLLPIFAALLLPALAKAKSRATAINCVSNLKQLGLAVRIWSVDNGEKYPAATNWCDGIINEAGSPKIYVCPSAPALRSGYAFNAKLSGLEEGQVDPGTVMIFESDAGWNASGGKELMITKARHNNRFNVCLADGSVQQMTEAQVRQLRWDPKPETNTNNP